MGKIEIYIYGASGHGKVVYDAATSMGLHVVGFIDDDTNKHELLDKPVFRFNEIERNSKIALGIGDNRVRYKIYEKIIESGHQVATVIDKNAVVSNFSQVGEGTVVFANCIINSGAKIGKGCIVNTAAIVEHDCVVGDFSHISPNAALAGGVEVGSFTQIGIGSCVRELIKIGDNIVVGAGTVVVKNLESNGIYAGVPAKLIKK